MASLDGGASVDRQRRAVLELDEVADDEHLRARGTIVSQDGMVSAAPAPRLSRTPGRLRPTKEMYKSGGENVYPAEVENVLSVHPAVADIAVVGVPDAKWGEVGVAVVVPAAGAELTLADLHAFAREKLARYKLPKRLALVEELPRNVTGKVSREVLRGRYGPAESA